jgi:two-component system response regulator ChvI
LTRTQKILLIDDDTDITRIFKLALEKRGFDIKTYNDPTAALAGIQPNVYDLAIFDMRMPTMDGFDLYQQFKKIDDRTAVCFLTAFDVEEDDCAKRLLLDPRVKAFLKKPIGISELILKINEIMNTNPLAPKNLL